MPGPAAGEGLCLWAGGTESPGQAARLEPGSRGDPTWLVFAVGKTGGLGGGWCHGCMRPTAGCRPELGGIGAARHVGWGGQGHCARLGWAGLGYAGPDWLNWVGPGRTGLCWAGLD